MELLQFIPMIADHFYNPITGLLHIEINGVGSRYDWLEIFRTIVGIIFGILSALGLETLIRIFKRKK